MDETDTPQELRPVKEDQSRWVAVFLVLMAILAAIFFGGPYVGEYLDRMSAQADGEAWRNSCVKKADVKTMFEDSPDGRVRGLRIVTWRDISTISFNDQRVECHATVTLNNARAYSYAYSFTKEQGQVIIRGVGTPQ